MSYRNPSQMCSGCQADEIRHLRRHIRNLANELDDKESELEETGFDLVDCWMLLSRMARGEEVPKEEVVELLNKQDVDWETPPTPYVPSEQDGKTAE